MLTESTSLSDHYSTTSGTQTIVSVGETDSISPYQYQFFKIIKCHENNFINNSRDVIDNKTDYILPHYNIKRMSELYCSENERLKTFEHWPLEFIDKIILAKTGMFYTGDDDKVKCYFCEVEIGRWEENDNPISEHIRWSPNCPLLRRRTTNNVSIDPEQLDRILPPISYDICGANDIEIRPNAYAEGSISSPTPILTPSTNNISPNNSLSNIQQQQTTSTTTFLYPDHPEYAIESARVRSFAEWPRTMKQKPEQLSEAGFFYTGTGDRVKCFSCGGGLKDWDDNDEPWEQHALWLTNCRYLKLMKGSNYIEAIAEKFKTADESKETTSVNNEVNQQHDEQEQQSQSQQQQHEIATSSMQSNKDTTLKLNNSENSTTSSGSSSTVSSDDDESIPSSESSLNSLKDLETVCKQPKLDCNINSDQNGDKKNIAEDKLCKICYAGEYNTAFLPCGHVVACAKCASSVTKCPMCRKPFTDVMRVYFS